jgi:hypothetical protein
MGVTCLHVKIMQTKSKSMAAQIPLPTAVAVGSKLLFSELRPHPLSSRLIADQIIRHQTLQNPGGCCVSTFGVVEKSAVFAVYSYDILDISC